MTSYFDLKDFLLDKSYDLRIAADAEPFVHKKVRNKLVTQSSAGGVSVALEPVARAGDALFIARGKTKEDEEMVDENSIITVNHTDPYTLKRLFLSEEDLEDYYFGFSNQTLWPLCHVAFEAPVFNPTWFSRYEEVNKAFAEAIQTGKKKNTTTFYFLNDYQLSLVPSFLKKDKQSIVALFWHIPWPTWEIFRILPQKKQILESLLQCDFLAFHRGYHVRNFLSTVRRELEARIDEEKATVFYNNHATTVHSLPMGVDTDIIKGLAEPDDTDMLTTIAKAMFGIEKEKIPHEDFFKTTQVILGIDRLDYTKGLMTRLEGIERFLEKYPEFQEKVTYLGFLALSREQIPSYKALKKAVEGKAAEINKEFGTNNWKPIHLLPGVFSRKELIALYKNASVCLVTPLDDGMNLVSKEYVIAASTSNTPGMLVLSQFAGSATDLTQALIINPHDKEATADAIEQALTMDEKERKDRIMRMAGTLEEHNVYSWVMQFLTEAEQAARENRGI